MKAKMTCAVIIALVLIGGATYYLKSIGPTTPTAPTASTLTSTVNQPPRAAFSYCPPTRTLNYVAPADRDLIMFLNNSSDPEGDPLTSQWYIR